MPTRREVILFLVCVWAAIIISSCQVACLAKTITDALRGP